MELENQKQQQQNILHKVLRISTEHLKKQNILHKVLRMELHHPIFHLFIRLTVVLSVVLLLDEGDYPENLQSVYLYHNK